MAFTINRVKVSGTAWGDVDKGALGRKLAAAYAKGEVTKAQIREVYAYVPDEAFGKNDDGPTFAYSKAWGPHHVVSGNEIVLNRSGLGAAAAAAAGGRAQPSLSGTALAAAKRHLRRHYRQIKEEMPEGLEEADVRKLDRGKPLEELVKGSLDYTMERIRSAFRTQFAVGPENWTYYICEIFADHVIVSSWKNDLAPDEYWHVTYTKDGDAYSFAPREEWEVVELAYQPQTVEEPADEEAVEESAHRNDDSALEKPARKPKGKRFEERVGAVEINLLEAQADGGPRQIRVLGAMQVDVVNGNNRRYRKTVVREALDELRQHLHESAGQGRAIQVLGEAEHPSGKASRRPNLLETVVKWNQVTLDGRSVDLEGHIVETSKGKDILALAEGGVQFGVSMRGYGDSITANEKGRQIEEVTELHITGFDLVLEPSFENVALLESKQETENEDMDPEKLKEFIQQHPELFEGLLTKKLEEMQASDVKSLEERTRKLLGIDEQADLGKALQEAVDAKRKLDETEQQKALEEAIAEHTKELPYGKELNEQFVAAVREAKPATGDAVKALVESKRKEYDAIVAKHKLAAMGYRGVHVVGPVIETELGVPEYARAAHEFTEALVRGGHAQRRNWNKLETMNELYAAKYLERFDKVYGHHLRRESRELQEAEQTVDLNLPYSVSRSVMAVVLPRLVATGVFDFDTIETSPTLLFFENYAAETGAEPSVTDEAVTADLDAWVDLANKRIKPTTVVVTNSGATVTYVEGDDYVIDYANGRLMALSTGDITDSQSLLADYTYSAVRKGEMQPIERGKGQLSSVTITAAADRLATQISAEAIVFSRSQVGWDAVVRTQNMLINEIRRRIDQGAIFKALASSLSVASNVAGTWTAATDTPNALAELIGKAKIKVVNRLYEPTAVLLSASLSDSLSNADQFTAAGARADSSLRAEGFVGTVKGLPCFESTEHPDSYVQVVNRELVAHRVFQAMALKGPFASYEAATGKLIAADQYYAEEFNVTESPVANKGSLVKIA